MCKVKIILLISLFNLTGHVVATEYYPLQIGNKWKYVVHANNDYEIESEVLGKIIIGNVAWYKLRDFNDNFWVRSGESGQYEAINWFGEDNPLNTLPVDTLMFRYPIKKTTTYEAGEDTVIAFYPDLGDFFAFKQLQAKLADENIQGSGQIFNPFALD